MSDSTRLAEGSLHLKALFTSGYLLLLANGTCSAAFTHAGFSREKKGAADYRIDFEDSLLNLRSGQQHSGRLVSFQTAAVFRHKLDRDRKVHVWHRENETVLDVEDFPADSFHGLRRLIDATQEARRDGIYEGLGFSLRMDMSEALQNAREDLEYALRDVSAPVQQDDPAPLLFADSSRGGITDMASLAESGMLNAFGNTPILYVRLRLNYPSFLP